MGSVFPTLGAVPRQNTVPKRLTQYRSLRAEARSRARGPPGSDTFATGFFRTLMHPVPLEDLPGLSPKQHHEAERSLRCRQRHLDWLARDEQENSAENEDEDDEDDFIDFVSDAEENLFAEDDDDDACQFIPVFPSTKQLAKRPDIARPVMRGRLPPMEVCIRNPLLSYIDDMRVVPTTGSKAERQSSQSQHSSDSEEDELHRLQSPDSGENDIPEMYQSEATKMALLCCSKSGRRRSPGPSVASDVLDGSDDEGELSSRLQAAEASHRMAQGKAAACAAEEEQLEAAEGMSRVNPTEAQIRESRKTKRLWRAARNWNGSRGVRGPPQVTSYIRAGDVLELLDRGNSLWWSAIPFGNEESGGEVRDLPSFLFASEELYKCWANLKNYYHGRIRVSDLDMHVASMQGVKPGMYLVREPDELFEEDSDYVLSVVKDRHSFQHYMINQNKKGYFELQYRNDLSMVNRRQFISIPSLAIYYATLRDKACASIKLPTKMSIPININKTTQFAVQG